MKHVKTRRFDHPRNAFHLEFPAHWEHRVEDDGRTCGFGPYERDNVALWISILPARVNTEEIGDDLSDIFHESLRMCDAINLREDRSLLHTAMKADNSQEGQGGHYWIVAGGDLMLFASSQVPVDERDEWNREFNRLMASLKITRQTELLILKTAARVLEGLSERYPDEDYALDGDRILGKSHRVSLDNIILDVREDPSRMDEIADNFVAGLVAVRKQPIGSEAWDDVVGDILPVLKPQAFTMHEAPRMDLHVTPWLDDIVICYAIRSTEKGFRFITNWDLNRWGIDNETLHQRAIDNLSQMEWPRRLNGTRQPEGGRLILVSTDDSFEASRLLHPKLHGLFSRPLGTPFLAAIPNRDTLVVFSNKKSLRRRVGRKVREDYNSSSYAISPRLFLVTPDGIAPG